MPRSGHRAGPGAAVAGQAAAALADCKPAPYWLDRADAPPPAPPLTGGTGARLAVIGGGFTGLWTALMAVERDPSADVVLLEARRVGWAASGRNGGFCSASLTHGIANGIARFEAEMPALVRLGQANLDEIAATIGSRGIDCGFERTGELAVATAPWQLDGLATEAAAAARYGEQATALDAGAVRAEVDSPTYLGGVWYPGSCAMLDPARLAWGLRRACIESGVRIYENTPVRAIAEAGRAGLRLSTPRGSVHAGRVALGAGCYRPLLRRLRHYLVPVYDYALMTEPLSGPQLAAIGWRNRQGLADSGNQFHYYRLTSDNRILWGGYDAVYYNGGRITAARDQRPETFATLAANFFGTFPQLARPGPVHARLGRRDRHLQPVLRVLRNRLRQAARLRGGVHGPGRRREPVRRERDPRPAGRGADRADGAGDGAHQAGAVPARAGQVGRHPADPGVAGQGRSQRGPQGCVAARAGPAWPRLRVLTRGGAPPPAYPPKPPPAGTAVNQTPTYGGLRPRIPPKTQPAGVAVNPKPTARGCAPRSAAAGDLRRVGGDLVPGGDLRQRPATTWQQHVVRGRAAVCHSPRRRLARAGFGLLG